MVRVIGKTMEDIQSGTKGIHIDDFHLEMMRLLSGLDNKISIWDAICEIERDKKSLTSAAKGDK